jgi:hypothetical protein
VVSGLVPFSSKPPAAAEFSASGKKSKYVGIAENGYATSIRPLKVANHLY